MSKVNVARLKKSLEETESENYRNGREAGFDWASEYAEAAQLRRLKQYRDASEFWNDHFQSSTGVVWDHLGPVGNIAAAVISSDPTEIDWDDIGPFFEEAIGEDYEGYLEEPEYMQGFFEGAIEAWEQAEAQM